MYFKMSYFMAISFSHLDMVFWRDLSQISFDCRGQKPISVSSNNKTKTKQKTKTTPPLLAPKWPFHMHLNQSRAALHATGFGKPPKSVVFFLIFSGFIAYFSLIHTTYSADHKTGPGSTPKSI